MNDESNALREHVVKYQKAGMKDYFKWSQEAANLMRQAAAQIESLTREKENALKTEALQSGVIAGLQMRNVALERENKTLRAELGAAKVDAERYRWLRGMQDKGIQLFATGPSVRIEFPSDPPKGAKYIPRSSPKGNELDTAIDTARSRGETGETNV